MNPTFVEKILELNSKGYEISFKIDNDIVKIYVKKDGRILHYFASNLEMKYSKISSDQYLCFVLDKLIDKFDKDASDEILTGTVVRW